MKKYENSNASYMCAPSGAGHGVSMRCMTGSTGVTSCGKHAKIEIAYNKADAAIQNLIDQLAA
jgi:hypothetical protein